MDPAQHLRVLTRPSANPPRWVVICIDRYMVAEGDTPQEALANFDRVLVTEMALGVKAGHLDDPLKNLPPAPEIYRREFDNGWTPPPPKRVKQSNNIKLALESRMAMTSALPPPAPVREMA